MVHTIDWQAGKSELFTSIIQWLGLGKNSTVLDVGCADGRDYFGSLAQTECILTGIESDPDLMQRCRARFSDRANVSIRRGDAENLDFAEDSFDVVVCNDTICLCDKKKVFSEIYRVLRRGGVFVCLWNLGFHCYLHGIIHPRSDRTFLFALGRSVYIALNTVLYRCCGIKLCSITINTKGELRRLAAEAGFLREKLWTYRGKTPPTLCLLCTKE